MSVSDQAAPTTAIPQRRYIYAAIMGLIATVVTFTIMLPRGVGMNPNFGIWSTLALDLLDGVFYRPVVSEFGYGGTRYFPVVFSLQAIFIKITGHVIASGYAVVTLGAIALFSGLYTLLRELKVPRGLALCGLGFALTSIAVQIALITFQGDLVPAAINVWGLALVVMAVNRNRALLALACVVFGLAFMAKITTVFGVTASVLWLFFRRDYKSAVGLTLGTWAAMGTGIASLIYFSDGRFVEAFQSVATGGMTLADFLRYPWMLVRSMGVDLPTTIVVACALTGLFLLPKGKRFALPTFVFVITALVTAILFLSPGVEFNHFVDIHIASVLFLVTNVAAGTWREKMTKAVPVFVMASAVVVMTWNVIWLILVPDAYRLRDRYALLEVVPDKGGPVLSEDPSLLTMEGTRPFMLDAFALHQVVEHEPSVKEDLFNRLAAHEFRAVILGPIPYFMHKKLDFELKGKQFYGGFQFCEGFLETLQRHYEPVKFTDLYVVFLPKESTASGADATVSADRVG